MHQGGKVSLAVLGLIFLVDGIAHDGEYLFFLAFRVAVYPVVSMAVAEADDDGVLLLRLVAVERFIPVDVKMSGYLFVVGPYSFLVNLLVVLEEMGETAVAIEVCQQIQELRLFHFVPARIEGTGLFIHQREGIALFL